MRLKGLYKEYRRHYKARRCGVDPRSKEIADVLQRAWALATTALDDSAWTPAEDLDWSLVE